MLTSSFGVRVDCIWTTRLVLALPVPPGLKLLSDGTKQIIKVSHRICAAMLGALGSNLLLRDCFIGVDTMEDSWSFLVALIYSN